MTVEIWIVTCCEAFEERLKVSRCCFGPLLVWPGRPGLWWQHPSGFWIAVRRQSGRRPKVFRPGSASGCCCPPRPWRFTLFYHKRHTVSKTSQCVTTTLTICHIEDWTDPATEKTKKIFWFFKMLLLIFKSAYYNYGSCNPGFSYQTLIVSYSL